MELCLKIIGSKKIKSKLISLNASVFKIFRVNVLIMDYSDMKIKHEYPGENHFISNLVNNPTLYTAQQSTYNVNMFHKYSFTSQCYF